MTNNDISGPIFRLSLAGDEIVVLNNGKDAEELVSSSRFLSPFETKSCLFERQLGQRSKNYSSRKQLIFAGKYQSNTKRMVLLPYGEELRKQRAAVHYMLQSRGKHLPTPDVIQTNVPPSQRRLRTSNRV